MPDPLPWPSGQDLNQCPGHVSIQTPSRLCSGGAEFPRAPSEGHTGRYTAQAASTEGLWLNPVYLVPWGQLACCALLYRTPTVCRAVQPLPAAPSLREKHDSSPPETRERGKCMCLLFAPRSGSTSLWERMCLPIKRQFRRHTPIWGKKIT